MWRLRYTVVATATQRDVQAICSGRSGQKPVALDTGARNLCCQMSRSLSQAKTIVFWFQTVPLRQVSVVRYCWNQLNAARLSQRRWHSMQPVMLGYVSSWLTTLFRMYRHCCYDLQWNACGSSVVNYDLCRAANLFRSTQTDTYNGATLWPVRAEHMLCSVLSHWMPTHPT